MIQTIVDVVGIMSVTALVPLAVAGAVTLFGPRETERQRIARETREAERRITEIGRHAQAVILGEALRRARANPKATGGDVGPQDTGRTFDGNWG